MLPYVVIHNAVSVDGRMDRVDVDLELYYSLISTWKEDLTLVGSETFMDAEQWEAWVHDGNTDPSKPLLSVVDSRGRFKRWEKAVPSPYWRAGVALCSRSTPQDHLEYLRRVGVDAIVTGKEKVDLREGLERLASDHGAKVIRVDSGGTLNGALLRAGLIDEVSVLMLPQLIGGTTPSSLFRAEDLPANAAPISLELISSRELKGGALWLRYRVLK